MTDKLENDELRLKIDDLTTRLRPTGELDNDNNPVYEEARLPLSILNNVVALFTQSQLALLESLKVVVENPNFERAEARNFIDNRLATLKSTLKGGDYE